MESDGNQVVVKRSPLSNELEEYDVQAFLKVGFSIHSELIAHTQDLSERWFYIHRAAREFWGFRQFQLQLRNNLYHQQGSMPSNFALTLPDEKQRQVAQLNRQVKRNIESKREQPKL